MQELIGDNFPCYHRGNWQMRKLIPLEGGERGKPKSRACVAGNRVQKDWSITMPSNESTPLPERVSSAYTKLSAVAKDLNSVSDELGELIARIDSALKKLNLGVSVWIKIAVRGADLLNDDPIEETDQIGYVKIRGKWGISLSTMSLDVTDGSETFEQWPFNDAPRLMRLSAIDKIADLLEALTGKAAEMKDIVAGKLNDARSVAEAVTRTSGNRVLVRGAITYPPTSKRGEVAK